MKLHIEDTLTDKIYWTWKQSRFNDWYYNIRNFFFPQQRWIVKSIRYNDWCDKDKIIEDVLYACVVNFVEKEHGSIDDVHVHSMNLYCEDPNAAWSVFYQELVLCYNWIKYERVRLQKEIDDEWENIEVPSFKVDRVPDGSTISKMTTTSPFDEYKKVDNLEKHLKELDDEWLTWIVENREWMWT